MKRLIVGLAGLGTIVLLGYAFSVFRVDARPESPAAGTSDLPGRRQLFESLSRNRTILVVYGARVSDVRNDLREKALKLRDSAQPYFRVEIKADTETRPGDLKGQAVVLIGSPRSNRLITDLAADLPVSFTSSGFRFAAKDYSDASDILQLLFPNPEDSRYPLFLLTGNSARILSKWPLSLRFRDPDYTVFRKGARRLMGWFSQEEGRRWRIDPARRRDFSVHLALETRHFRFFAHGSVTQESLDALSLRREATWKRVVSFLGKEPAFEKIDYHVFPSLEEKGLQTRNIRSAHAEREGNSVWVSLEPGLDGDSSCKETALIVRSVLGIPMKAVLERGLTTFFSKTWAGRDRSYWSARLYQAGMVPSVAELVSEDEASARESILSTILDGALVRFLIQTWGREIFLHRYPTWDPEAGELARLEPRWRHFLARQLDQFRREIASDRSSFPAFKDFGKGVNFTQEGFRIFDGYASKEAEASLAHLKSLGVNTVALVPYGFLRHLDQPAPIQLPRGAAGENDESIIHAAMAARQLGISVLLKPQIWSSAGWTGNLEMSNPEAWNRFFQNYERWIAHYALLAEAYHLEGLCVGVELERATVGHEDRWIRMCRRLRRIYSGQLTYSANWGSEFEKLHFWKAFDLIGLDDYYSLYEGDHPSDEQLLQGARKIVRKIEAVQKRFGKPVILTEVGFTSGRQPWKNPHRENRRADPNPKDQARCYRAVLQSLTGQPWCRGIYWWKWPTYLAYGGPRNNGFTPNAKDAARVLEAWYRSPWPNGEPASSPRSSR